eukprot:TRINITY_DN3893_c0_g3_i1.p1 TRINITY_DN3893_c0_g3~~TRINITY_DN3893_c0_g3_i1.p1  ORF type:complete len:138 (+),score=24.44 TRINITY_DN3893_c0_g3_i1:108-521(+)
MAGRKTPILNDEELYQEFRAFYCHSENIPTLSALQTCIKAAFTVNPGGITIEKDGQSTKKQADSLPADLSFHSLFRCPVSRELIGVDDAAVLLTCGHVISRSAMVNLASVSRHQHGQFQCPTCPQQMKPTETIKLHF